MLDELTNVISAKKDYIEFEAVPGQYFKNPHQVEMFQDNGCVTNVYGSASSTEDLQISIVNHQLRISFMLTSYDTSRRNNINKVITYIAS